MNKETISLLNSLIETVKDGEQGFKTAAEGLTSPDLKAKFLQYSRERGQMAGELQAEVRRLGGDPEHSGSMSGAVHRGWLDIKSAITGRDDHAIAAEAERGEDVAKNAFENALKEVPAGTTQVLVQRLAARVRQAHDDVRNIRDRQTVLK
jgi:uncharacterized protein (TIGR02284 family)